MIGLAAVRGVVNARDLVGASIENSVSLEHAFNADMEFRFDLAVWFDVPSERSVSQRGSDGSAQFPSNLIDNKIESAFPKQVIDCGSVPRSGDLGRCFFGII